MYLYDIILFKYIFKNMVVINVLFTLYLNLEKLMGIAGEIYEDVTGIF